MSIAPFGETLDKLLSVGAIVVEGLSHGNLAFSFRQLIFGLKIGSDT